MPSYSYLDNLQLIDPTLDDNCQRLADYLAGGLNYAIAYHSPDTIAVRATRSYDAVDIDTSSFPMLKVFRQKEGVTPSEVFSTDLVISYSMLMPNVKQLPGILHWVDRHIIAMLAAWSSSDRSCPFQLLPNLADKITSEYRIMVGDLQQPVYAYLRISLPAREFS